MKHTQTSDYAKRLQAAREKSGKTLKEMAELIGVTIESYRDLEWHDNEILNCISLHQLSLLANALNIDLREFFSSAPYKQSQLLTFYDLRDKIKEYLKTRSMTTSEFEERVGWMVESLLANPDQFLEYNICALTDICDEIGVDWVSVLPAK